MRLDDSKPFSSNRLNNTSKLSDTKPKWIVQETIEMIIIALAVFVIGMYMLIKKKKIKNEKMDLNCEN